MTGKEQEIWSAIPGWPHQASNMGRIRSNTRTVIRSNGRPYTAKGRILKQSKGEKGYLYVCLCSEGREKTVNSHRLVWMAFKGKIPPGIEIHHISRIKDDNSLTNLNI